MYLQYLENEERFKQFMKVMNMNPNGGNMSIRVLIDESTVGKARVIDY